MIQLFTHPSLVAAYIVVITVIILFVIASKQQNK